ncbi:MAG: hypothetical protein OXR66_05955 [Candidatus Woesearchaeota archaeon]|nr:hypothetical protein [Candidatus Woesearchaeota archaeon]
MRWYAYIILVLLLLPSASASLKGDLLELEDELETFTTDADIIMVQGSKIPVSLDVVMPLLRAVHPDYKGLPAYKEQELTQELREGKLILLVGGPEQSELAKHVYETGTGNAYDVEAAKILLYEADGQKFLILSDNRGFGGNLERQTSYSPLAKIMPEAYVPAAAAGTGVILLLLAKAFKGLLFKATRYWVSSKLMAHVTKKATRRRYVGTKIFGIRVKFREIAAVIFAGMLFGFGIATSYYKPGMSIVLFYGTVMIVNIAIYLSRNGARVILDKHHGAHTEFKLWPYGIFVTAITAYFGNNCALAGYVDTKEKNPKTPPGELAYKVMSISYNVFFGLWIWNFFMPRPILQMAMLISLSLCFIQMFPIAPFDGIKIYQWSKKKWWWNFIPMLALYIAVHVMSAL